MLNLQYLKTQDFSFACTWPSPARCLHTFSCEMDPDTIFKIVRDTVQDAVKAATSTLVNVSFMEDLINKLKNELQDSFNLELEKATKPLACKISALEAKAEVHEAHMKNLEEQLGRCESNMQEKFKEYDNAFMAQGIQLDDMEQYSRRTCLRIFGVPLETPSSARENCKAKVVEICREMEVEIEDKDIDRAHRIGKKYNEGGINHQAIIVKFHSWDKRTTVYRGRKKLSGKSIRLDLTQRRAKLLSQSKLLVAENAGVEAVFVDVNCRLGLKTVKGDLKFFNTKLEFFKLLDDLA